MKNLYCFTKENKKFTNYFTITSHPDGELYKYKIFLNDKEITKDMIQWFKRSSNHFHLGYIGFKSEFQNKGILKNFIHPHCIEFMRKKGIKVITLKPLAIAVVVWILLGFEIENELEELHIKQLIKEFLLENDIKTEDFDKMQLKEIVNRYKNILKSKKFPPKLERIYYTNFKKVIE